MKLSPLSSPLALLRFFGTAAVGLALDLWTKKLAFDRLVDATEPYRLIPGWLEFQVTINHGAVFGKFQGQRVLFMAVSVAAIVFLVFLFAGSDRRRGYQVLLGMLLAGVLGNLYDRVTLGYVRDMIHALPRWQGFFPWIFNVADSLLCVGVGLIVLSNLVKPAVKVNDEIRMTNDE
jgi:signal peptidase II